MARGRHDFLACRGCPQAVRLFGIATRHSHDPYLGPVARNPQIRGGYPRTVTSPTVASLTVVCGPMFAGKTTELQRRIALAAASGARVLV
ncbi:MAG: hypothetical protein ACO3QC_11885, partial [Phycisphaerales bacterium]